MRVGCGTKCVGVREIVFFSLLLKLPDHPLILGREGSDTGEIVSRVVSSTILPSIEDVDAVIYA